MSSCHCDSSVMVTKKPCAVSQNKSFLPYIALARALGERMLGTHAAVLDQHQLPQDSQREPESRIITTLQGSLDDQAAGPWALVPHWNLGGQETDLHSGLPISRVVRSWMSLLRRQVTSTHLLPITKKQRSGGVTGLSFGNLAQTLLPTVFPPLPPAAKRSSQLGWAR